jgi:glyoxylate utilization-related uncharacterized protein
MQVSKVETATSREYETVGYVISGRAKLDLEGQTLNLRARHSWLIPAGATHQYTILEPFTAVEATRLLRPRFTAAMGLFDKHSILHPVTQVPEAFQTRS